MTRDQLAALFRVNRGTIANWASREEMPTAEGGGSGRQAKYRPSDCVAWRIAVIEGRNGNDGVNPQNARARKDTAQSNLYELELKKRQRELMPVAEAEREWNAAVADTKAAALQMPNAAAPSVVAAVVAAVGLCDACRAKPTTHATHAARESMLTAVRSLLRSLAKWGAA